MKKIILLLSILLFAMPYTICAQPDFDSATREVDRPFREEAEKELWRVPKKPEIKVEDSEEDSAEEEAPQEENPLEGAGGCMAK